VSWFVIGHIAASISATFFFARRPLKESAGGEDNMLIMISGPASADSEEERAENLAKLNLAAAEVFKKGHIPLVGVNAAGPVIEQAGVRDHYEAVMRICEALAERCDAVLVIGESPGAGHEREVFERRGCPVYLRLDEITAET
jgi:hypothetical protein